MTGFGSGKARVGDEALAIEVRSVNHKFCEVKARLPRELVSLEPLVQRAVKARVARGAIDVAIRREASSASGLAPTVDLALARAYEQALKKVASHLGLSDVLSLRDVVSQNGVIRMEEALLDVASAQSALESALTQALDGLAAMRAQEGEALKADLSHRLSQIETHVAAVVRLAPAAIAEYQQRMSGRVQELARNVPVDPQRLAQEVAIFAERTDVSEELARLNSHLEQFRTLLAGAEPVGRRMDFLVQEMHREVNTTGSKSQHREISEHIVAMKLELERLREQVQNVE